MYFLNKHAGMGSQISPAGILKQKHVILKHIIYKLMCSQCVVFFTCSYCFTCKRSFSGMFVCSSRMDVSSSLLVLVTSALLVQPLPLPALFAMTCSDRWRSCDSSGISRRRKTTSKRESKAEPILKTRTHSCDIHIFTVISGYVLEV